MHKLPHIMSQLTSFYIIFLFGLITEISTSFSDIYQYLFLVFFIIYSLFDKSRFDIRSFGLEIIYPHDMWIFKALGSFVNLIINMVLVYFSVRGFYELVFFYFFLETLNKYAFDITIQEKITFRRFIK